MDFYSLFYDKNIFAYVVGGQLNYKDLINIEKLSKYFRNTVENDEDIRIKPIVMELAWEALFRRDYPKIHENTKNDERYVFAQLDNVSDKKYRKYYKRYYEFMIKRNRSLISLLFALRESPYIETKSFYNNTQAMTKLYNGKNNDCDYIISTISQNLFYFIKFKNYPNWFSAGFVTKDLGEPLDLFYIMQSPDGFYACKVVTFLRIKFINFLQMPPKYDKLLMSNKILGF